MGGGYEAVPNQTGSTPRVLSRESGFPYTRLPRCRRSGRYYHTTVVIFWPVVPERLTMKLIPPMLNPARADSWISLGSRDVLVTEMADKFVSGVADVAPERRPVLGYATRSKSPGRGSDELKTGWSISPRGAFRQIGSHDEARPAGSGQHPTPMPITTDHGDDERAMGWRIVASIYPRGWNEPR